MKIELEKQEIVMICHALSEQMDSAEKIENDLLNHLVVLHRDFGTLVIDGMPAEENGWGLETIEIDIENSDLILNCRSLNQYAENLKSIQMIRKSYILIGKLYNKSKK